MSTDAIYQKYATAIAAVTGDGSWIDWGVMRLALRLAVQDAYAAGQETGTDLAAIVASQDKALQAALDQVDRLQAQLTVLEQELDGRRTSGAAWITEIEQLRQQLAAMDADNARLIKSLAADDGIQETLHRAIADRDAEIDRLTTSRTTHTNGNGANPTTTPNWNRDHPAWTALPAADLDVIDQLSSGLTTFRRLNRTLRRDLVLRVIRHLAAVHGEIKLSLYDAGKPAWMPTAGAVVMLSETGRWPDLVTMALEPAAA